MSLDVNNLCRRNTIRFKRTDVKYFIRPSEEGRVARKLVSESRDLIGEETENLIVYCICFGVRPGPGSNYWGFNPSSLS